MISCGSECEYCSLVDTDIEPYHDDQMNFTRNTMVGLLLWPWLMSEFACSQLYACYLSQRWAYVDSVHIQRMKSEKAFNSLLRYIELMYRGAKCINVDE